MGNTFDQINEIVDNLQLTINEASDLALIEKDILLEKLRNIYTTIACPPTAVKKKTEPVEVPTQESVEVPAAPVAAPKPEFKVNEGIREDVDLFFEIGEATEQVESVETAEVSTEIEQSTPAETEQPTPTKMEQPTPTKMEQSAPTKVEQSAPAASAEVQKPAVVPQESAGTVSQPLTEKKEQPAPKPRTVSDEDEVLHFLNIVGEKSEPAAPAQPQMVEHPQKQVVEQPLTVEQPKRQDPEPAKPAATAQRSINDLFSEKSKDNSLGSQFQHAKVMDLTKSISVNDKFAFIKDLFKNRGEEYSKAIQQLNHCTSLEAAFDCLERYKNEYLWDSTSNAYLTLCDLLRRKFQ